MSTPRENRDIEFLGPLVSDLFVAEAVYRHGHRIVVSMSYRFDRSRSNKLIKERLQTSGYDFSLSESEDYLTLTIDPRRRLRVPMTNIVLFILTLFSVYFVPVFVMKMNVASSWSEATDRTLLALRHGAGIEFTLAIMSILFVHEMGHYLASRHRHIVTSWPYFIPAPNLIGTFGAIIKSKSPFWNRRDLIEVGAAGPIAGWIVAIGWLVYGLSHSSILPAVEIPPDMLAFSMVGESLLIKFMVPILIGNAPPGYFYLLTEAAFAGWVGLLITAINLLPIGQLDGGHILYGLFRRKQAVLGKMAMVGLIAMGFQSTLWWVFAAFGLIFGVSHPPTLNDGIRPSPAALFLGIVSILILLLSFTPVPFE